MIFDEAGTYQIEYTATDDCGNETVAERTVIVEEPPTYRTVLYTDGTFIINESSRDEAANVAAHGQPTNVYAPFDPNGSTDTDKYIFATSTNSPWVDQRSLIKSVKIGEPISPTSMAQWFNGCNNLENIDFQGLDTSNVTSIVSMFSGCSTIAEIDLSDIDLSSVTIMDQAFANCRTAKHIVLPNTANNICTAFSEVFSRCSELQTIDISMIQASVSANAYRMFYMCGALVTIFATSGFTPQYGQFMFTGCNSLVGGSGTTFVSSQNDQTYARIDNPPDAPGYFTAKS